LHAADPSVRRVAVSSSPADEIEMKAAMATVCACLVERHSG
jgi:hypothetical protein